MNRPKNADVGKPLRSKRIPVQVTPEEYAEIEDASGRLGIPVSSFVRMKALEAARED